MPRSLSRWVVCWSCSWAGCLEGGNSLDCSCHCTELAVAHNVFLRSSGLCLTQGSCWVWPGTVCVSMVP